MAIPTKLKIPFVRKISQNLIASPRGKLYKKNVKYHFVDQNEEYTPSNYKCSYNS